MKLIRLGQRGVIHKYTRWSNGNKPPSDGPICMWIGRVRSQVYVFEGQPSDITCVRCARRVEQQEALGHD